jgi:hypothetical protein
MGYVFESVDRLLWSPSRDVGSFFLSETHWLENHLRMPSGLSEVMSDTIKVDLEQLKLFLERMTGILNNTSMRLLIKGTAVHLIALLAAGGGLTNDIGGRFPDEWLAEAIDLRQRRMGSN